MKVTKVLKTCAVTGGILCLVKGLDNRLEITDYFMESSKIPEEFDGFKILQISDYHAEKIPGLEEAIRTEAPDIIVSTGDLVHDKGSYLPGVQLCARLLEIAPVYAVTGNHDVWRTDYSAFDRDLTREGVKILHNERVFFERGKKSISLAGMDDPFTVDSNKIENEIKSVLSELESYDGYDILLFHRANLLDYFADSGFDLILSGHMHGGQFRLPDGRGVCAPKSSWSSNSPVFFPKYVGGHYKHYNTEMIVNRGLGNPMFIPRLFNRPEITVVTLSSKKDK